MLGSLEKEMSDDFHKAYVDARNIQLLRNDARRIRTKVQEARANPLDAGTRWPFELLQNAYDAGPRQPRSSVTISFGWAPVSSGFRVWFQHDAAPFAPQDIAALLSGGSNKEFESLTTTGRFGTGFLSTHVLSLQVLVEGLLEVGNKVAYFSIPLDRAGDEGAIAQNAEGAAEALRDIEATTVEDGIPSARFEWYVGDLETYARGVAALELALPYVFGTCPHLGRVSIRAANGEGETHTWEGSLPRTPSIDGIAWVERDIQGANADVSVFRVGSPTGGPASALFCIRDGEVLPPSVGLARLFLRFPLRGTASFPLGIVLDGPFVVDQERSRVSVTTGGAVIKDALNAALSAIQVARSLGTRNPYLLAFAGAVDSITDLSERAWWNQSFREFATAAARLPLVPSRGCFLPAIPADESERYADFPLRRIGEKDGPEEVPLEPVRALLEAADWCDPPSPAVAADWEVLVSGWTSLNVALTRQCISKICEQARDGRSTWAALAASTGGNSWLFELVEVVGAAWDARGGGDSAILNGLLPDQTGKLRDPKDLSIDDGVPETLKSIAEKLGIPIREQLIDRAFTDGIDECRWPHLKKAVTTAIPRRRTRDQVIDSCLKVLETKVPLQKRLPATIIELASLGIELVRLVWDEMGLQGQGVAQRIPLLLESGECDRASPGKKMLAPVITWRARSRAFSVAWPPSRVLSESFGTATTAAMVAWDLAIPDPLVRTRAAELKEARLFPMLRDIESEDQLAGLMVKDEFFNSIALLHPEVLNRCVESTEAAEALLGFLVVCLAREDQGWQTWRTVRARQAGHDVDLVVRDALWLGDLGSRAWVPTKGEGDSIANVRANNDTLKPMIRSEWLVDNKPGIDLLTQCFAFDALDLQLIGMGLAEVQLQEVRDKLARLVEVSQGDLSVLNAALNAAEEQHDYTSKITRLRAFGLAVQTAVGARLESMGLSVELVDRGFDFSVAAAEQTPIDDLPLGFDLGPYLVEVKSTVRDEVSLTPLQANTAGNRPERFVLCVVQLPAIPDESASEDELIALVETYAMFVVDLGPDAATTVAHVGAAARGAVGLRNEQELRYTVRQARWRAGLTLAEWVRMVCVDPEIIALSAGGAASDSATSDIESSMVEEVGPEDDARVELSGSTAKMTI